MDLLERNPSPADVESVPEEVRRVPGRWVEDLVLSSDDPRWPLFRFLDLAWLRWDAESWALLARQPAVPHLRRLSLAWNSIDDASLETLLGWSQLKTLTALELTGNDLTSQGIEALARCAALEKIEELSLSCNHVGDAGAKALARSPHLTRLRVLRLRHARIGPRGVKALAASANLNAVVALELSENRLTESAMAALASSRRLGALVHLSLADLGANYPFVDGHTLPPGDDGARAFAHALELPSLRALDLSGSGVGPSGVQALATADGMRAVTHLNLKRGPVGQALPLLAKLPSLTELCVTAAWLDDASVAAFAAARPRLRKLGISWNEALGPDSARAIARLELTELDAGHCALGEAGLEALVSTGTQREVLGLSAAGLGEGAPRLLERLDRSKLCVLHLGGNELDARAIAALPELPALRELTLDGNPLGDEGAAALTRSCAKLESLHLVSADIGEAGARALARANLPRLRLLGLLFNRIGDAGLEALSASTWFAGLVQVGLRENGVTRAGLVHVAKLAPRARWLRVDLSLNELEEEDYGIVQDAPWRWMEDLNLDRGYHHLDWPRGALVWGPYS